METLQQAETGMKYKKCYKKKYGTGTIRHYITLVVNTYYYNIYRSRGDKPFLANHATMQELYALVHGIRYKVLGSAVQYFDIM